MQEQQEQNTQNMEEQQLNQDGQNQPAASQAWRHWWVWLLIIALALLLLFGADNLRQRFGDMGSPAQTDSQQQVVFDVPSLLGMEAEQIKASMMESHGEPMIDRLPGEIEDIESGTLVWTDGDFMFGFDYNPDGSLLEDALIINGFTDAGHTVEQVLAAGNIDVNSDNYEVLVNPLGVPEVVNIWVIAL